VQQKKNPTRGWGFRCDMSRRWREASDGCQPMLHRWPLIAWANPLDSLGQHRYIPVLLRWGIELSQLLR